jgi:hypothetical protein
MFKRAAANRAETRYSVRSLRLALHSLETAIDTPHLDRELDRKPTARQHLVEVLDPIDPL